MTRNCVTNLLLAIMSVLCVRGGAGSSPAPGGGLISAYQSYPVESIDRHYTLTARVRLVLF